jgi:two-component system response regulator AlgR
MEQTSTRSIEEECSDERGRMPVLVVEDERIARNALAFLLSKSGFEATACESAEAALDSIDRKHPPRIALIDVDLPGMSGLDLAERLEKLYPNTISVLITAANGDRIDRFRSEHPVAYFRKPLDFPRLLQLLSRSRPAGGCAHGN